MINYLKKSMDNPMEKTLYLSLKKGELYKK